MSKNNLYDLIFVNISSSAIHCFFLVLGLYLLYRYFLTKKFINHYSKLMYTIFNKFINVLVTDIDNDTHFIEKTGKTKKEFIKDLKISIANQIKIPPSNGSDERKIRKLNNKKYLIAELLIIFFALLIVIFIPLFIIKYKNKFNYKEALFEVGFSFVLTFILVVIYQLYFIEFFAMKFIKFV